MTIASAGSGKIRGDSATSHDVITSDHADTVVGKEGTERVPVGRGV